MFDTLQEKFQNAFKSLRIQGVLNEETIDGVLREVRLALLEADVNFKVVKELLDRVRVKALDQEVRSSLTPTQEIIRIVRDELIEILGRKESLLTFSKDYPTIFLMVGLQGSGKTTTSGKLALWLAKRSGAPCWFQRTSIDPRRANNWRSLQKRLKFQFLRVTESMLPSNWPWPRGKMRRIVAMTF